MDSQVIAPAEYRRLAQRAMKGQFWPLTLVSGLSTLTGMRLAGLAARAGWLIALTLVLKLVHPMLDYGQKLVHTRRFRGKSWRFDMLLRPRMLPKLLGIWALRDALPLALIYAGIMRRIADPMSLAGQSLQALGLLLSVVLAFHYCMAEYLLVDAPGLSPIGALRGSRRHLSGHRFELFALMLSFLGWLALVLLALGIVFVLAPGVTPGGWIVLAYLLTLPLVTYVDMSLIAFFEVVSRRAAARATRRRAHPTSIQRRSSQTRPDSPKR